MEDDGQRLLQRLECFVGEVIQSSTHATAADELAERLDVLERIVELLRLKTGRVDNRVRMHDLIQSGFVIHQEQDGRIRLRVGGRDALAGTRGWRAQSERHQTDLQRPLLLYLLHFHDTGGRIDTLLKSFVGAIRRDLHPLDIETTGTGVTRVVTTTRSAARVLRLYGLMTDSDRTAYRTWELSVLGLLVAVRLHEQRPTLALQQHSSGRSWTGQFGGSESLSDDVREIVRALGSVEVVQQTLRRLCEPNRDVFATFDDVARIVAAYCARLHEQLEERAQERPAAIVEAEQKREASTMLRQIAETVPAGLFTEDVRKSLALEELLQTVHPS